MGTSPLVPAGTMAVFADTAPDEEFSVETLGLCLPCVPGSQVVQGLVLRHRIPSALHCVGVPSKNTRAGRCRIKINYYLGVSPHEPVNICDGARNTRLCRSMRDRKRQGAQEQETRFHVGFTPKEKPPWGGFGRHPWSRLWDGHGLPCRRYADVERCAGCARAIRVQRA